MLKLNDQFNSVSFLDKVQIGKLNFYPIKFDLKEIPKNLKSLDELFDLDLLKVTELSDGHLRCFQMIESQVFETSLVRVEPEVFGHQPEDVLKVRFNTNDLIAS